MGRVPQLRKLQAQGLKPILPPDGPRPAYWHSACPVLTYANGATRRISDGRWYAICLRVCFAMSGTDLTYAARSTKCP
eukprot:2367586-Rhodomonas_salina.2